MVFAHAPHYFGFVKIRVVHSTNCTQLQFSYSFCYCLHTRNFLHIFPPLISARQGKNGVTTVISDMKQGRQQDLEFIYPLLLKAVTQCSCTVSNVSWRLKSMIGVSSYHARYSEFYPRAIRMTTEQQREILFWLYKIHFGFVS